MPAPFFDHRFRYPGFAILSTFAPEIPAAAGAGVELLFMIAWPRRLAISELGRKSRLPLSDIMTSESRYGDRSMPPLHLFDESLAHITSNELLLAYVPFPFPLSDPLLRSFPFVSTSTTAMN